MATKQRRQAKRRTSKSPVPESIVNDGPLTITDGSFPMGSGAHQGDLIIIRIAALPKSAMPRVNRQLADGNTQGSRHILQAGEAFDCDAAQVVKAIKAACPKANPQDRYVGPVFRTVDGAADLVHPEHGDHLYRGDMVLAVVFQRNLDAEQREQRTVD